MAAALAGAAASATGVMRRAFYRGRRLSRAPAIADLRAMARRRLPFFILEYLESGAGDETTLTANADALASGRWVPRTLRSLPAVDIGTQFNGADSRAPMVIGPTGFNGLLWHDADVALARAAARQGIPFCLATLANASIERVAEATREWPQAERWLQLYLFKDRGIALELMQRARQNGFSTLVLTTDAVVYGKRDWESRNYRAFKKPDWRNWLALAGHPRWLWNVARPGLPRFENLDAVLGRQTHALAAAGWIERNMDTGIGWDDLDWLRARWDGRLLVKGILCADDAARAFGRGADGIVVSNHGGRQLQGSIASLEALPPIVERVGGRGDIFLDSGIRSGQDILRALRLGACGVLLGRAALYGVAAGGEAGACRALDILCEETGNGLAQLGCGSLARLNDVGLLLPPSRFMP
jgi:(S)-mandelate dehydrogenase